MYGSSSSRQQAAGNKKQQRRRWQQSLSLVLLAESDHETHCQSVGVERLLVGRMQHARVRHYEHKLPRTLPECRSKRIVSMDSCKLYGASLAIRSRSPYA
eukprot:13099667-Alexandrium_andersonii.AAC.1